MPGDWVTLADVTSPYSITGLEPNTEYEVQAQAVNAVGVGAWSDSATATTLQEQPVAATFNAVAGTLAVAVTVNSPLQLSDFDTTGLDVEAAALIEASGAGTVGGTLYADSTNGGSDTVLDGELGLGPDNTVISLIRRQSTTVLRLNDRDTPASFHIGNYFAASGDGNDLTVSLQTANDGLVTFSTLAGGAANAVRFTLTPNALTLLDNIASGDRFILAFTRPGAKPVAATFTAVGGNPGGRRDQGCDRHEASGGHVCRGGG